MKLIVSVLLALSFLCVVSNAQYKIQNSLFTLNDTRGYAAEPFLQQETQPLHFKSVTLAVVLSVLVPGTGELYAGNFETGRYSMVAEGALWVLYAAFNTHANWVIQDAKVFATEHAGANFTGKGSQFNVDIGNYPSVQDYNQAKLITRDFNLLYTDPSSYWKWDSDADRVSFKNARIRSDEIYQNGKFVIAAAVVNRIFSAFSAGRAAAAYNRKVLIEGAWNLEAYPTSTVRLADGMAVGLSYTF
jgi:hypothetical protein